jgi:predicted nucleotidyltransferase
VPSLTQRERDCVDRFYALLEKRLGERLIEVRMFGSAARGDMWPNNSPMHSDIDLLVVTRDEASSVEQEELIDETYPMSLECGRQISPHFFSERRLKAPDDEGTRDFLQRMSRDAVVEWPAARRESSAQPTAT